MGPIYLNRLASKKDGEVRIHLRTKDAQKGYGIAYNRVGYAVSFCSCCGISTTPMKFHHMTKVCFFVRAPGTFSGFFTSIFSTKERMISAVSSVILVEPLHDTIQLFDAFFSKIDFFSSAFTMIYRIAYTNGILAFSDFKSHKRYQQRLKRMAPMKFHRVLQHENFHPATLQGGISTQMFFTACLTGGDSRRKITFLCNGF